MLYKEDLLVNKGNFKGAFFIICFRISNAIQSKGKFFRYLGFPFRAFYKICFRWLLGTDIPDTTKIGKGCAVYHGHSLIIHDDCIIGDYFTVRHNTTIGQARKGGGAPIIGDYVEVGANAVIIGDIHIGSYSIIAAGAVVIKDVPEKVIVAGNPARVVKVLE
ncbi:serine O-acetyltransferase [Flectobacillus major]|uniref:serine O-acetyltransferase n=1 Tax=Flectobacillus major TaxID=103 RepID=UPI0003FF5BB6|nr:serine acetyltransferase [Flectobacillus major]